MRESKKEPIRDEVASEIPLENRSLQACAVYSLTDPVRRIVLRDGVAKGKGDFTRSRLSLRLLVDVEEILRVCRIEVFGHSRRGLTSALEECIKRPVQR